MKANRILLSLAVLSLSAQMLPEAGAAPRQRPANPRGAMDPRGVADPRGVRDPRGAYDPRGVRDPRGVADPRGVFDPRGIADPRGVFDPRGPFDPRNPAAYMYNLPAAAAARAVAGVTYYVCSGIYYYPYYVNGQTVYVKAVVVNGAPTVPPCPY